MGKQQVVFHTDVDSVFLSWGSVYRLSQDPEAPDLWTIPAVVGGDRGSWHGIVLAKSTPVKAYGITTGEPLVQALKKCPGLTVVPSRLDIYIENSRKLIHLLENYTLDIEKFSIDEAFLDMTETIHLFGEPMDVTRQTQEWAKRGLGFTVNVGVAPNKLLAKMVSDFQKPDKRHSLRPGEVPEKMWPMSVRELFFVGGAAEKEMTAVGINTIGDLARCDVHPFCSHLGNKYGTLTHNYANGIGDEPVAEWEPINKGYGNSITLSRDASDYETACRVALFLCKTVGARLRSDHVVCNCTCVEFRDWQLHNQSHQLILSSPTDSTSVIYQNACRLLKDSWDFMPLRLTDVRTSRIAGDDYCQLSLFDTGKNKRMEQFEKAVDSIRGKLGTDSIKRASFPQSNAIVDHAASKKKHLGG